MMLYSPETVMALHKARVADERRERTGRRRSSSKASARAATRVALRPAAVR